MTFSLSRMASADALVERLRAVAGLEQKRLAIRHLSQLVLETTGLAGKDQRRLRGEFGLDPREVLSVGPDGTLGGGVVAPRTWRPLEVTVFPSTNSKGSSNEATITRRIRR